MYCTNVIYKNEETHEKYTRTIEWIHKQTNTQSFLFIEYLWAKKKHAFATVAFEVASYTRNFKMVQSINAFICKVLNWIVLKKLWIILQTCVFGNFKSLGTVQNRQSM